MIAALLTTLPYTRVGFKGKDKACNRRGNDILVTFKIKLSAVGNGFLYNGFKFGNYPIDFFAGILHPK